MIRVGGFLLLYGGGLLHKGKSSANCSLNEVICLIAERNFCVPSRKMVWVTVNDQKVDETVDVMKTKCSCFKSSTFLKLRIFSDER